MVDIRDKIEQLLPRWLGHVIRQSKEALVKTIFELRVEGRRGRGKSKLTRDQFLKKDLVV